jgi:hypothetical protein
VSLLALVLKALSTALVVVSASVVAERTRPFLAAMVLSLPVSTGPAYVILALDHDAAFIADASLSSIISNISIVPAAIAYAALARRGLPLLPCLSAMLAAWLATILVSRGFTLSLTGALLLNAAVFTAAIAATWPWRRVAPPPPPPRRWYDLPLRVGLVVVLVVFVVSVSEHIGPAVTGIAALFPASYSSFILLMHGRLGGPVVAAAVINGLVMLIGFTGFLAGIHLFAREGHVWAGLLVGFAVPLVWSALVLAANTLRKA